MPLFSIVFSFEVKNEHSGTPQTAMVNLKFSESAIKEIKSDKIAEILACRESQMITFQKHILYYLTLCTAHDPEDAEQAIQEFNYEVFRLCFLFTLQANDLFKVCFDFLIVAKHAFLWLVNQPLCYASYLCFCSVVRTEMDGRGYPLDKSLSSG